MAMVRDSFDTTVTQDESSTSSGSLSYSPVSSHELVSKSHLVAYEGIRHKLATLHGFGREEGEEDDEEGREIFHHDLNHKLCELQEHSDAYYRVRNWSSYEQPVYIENVRISPGTMLFKDAYDGKKYTQTLTLTNCGKHSVVIRIYPPTSTAFKIESAKCGQKLSSGLSFKRKINYRYTKPTAFPQGLMDIYVNNSFYRYKLLVFTCYTKIYVSPKVIDFGDVDVGMLSETKYLTIKNSGTRQAQFSIDLGGNQLEVIIHPMKATVLPNQSRQISLEVFGKVAGEFQQEFWIKTEPLQRIFIHGNFIEPKLKVEFPLAAKNFIFLYYGKIFAGAKVQKNVVIKNHSSNAAVFCVMAMTLDGKYPLTEAEKKDFNYEQFYINPKEGRLHSFQKYIMGLSFEPKILRNCPRNYYLCSVVVDVKRCRVGNASIADAGLFCPEVLNQQGSPLLDTISVVTLDSHGKPEQEIKTVDDTCSILLYGEVEMASISLAPKNIHLYDLKVHELYVETLECTNESSTHPLVLNYNKIACVEVEPTTIHLGPKQKFELKVKIRPDRMGSNSINVVFSIMFHHQKKAHNVGKIDFTVIYTAEHTDEFKRLKRKQPCFVPGITPVNNNEVGYLVDDIRFNTKIKMPRQTIVDKKQLVLDKTNNALIAFPNERPQSLRPWRNPVPCQTIFTKLPRIITKFDPDYDLNPREKLLRDTKESYYLQYIRNLAEKRQPPPKPLDLEEIEVYDDNAVLMPEVQGKKGCPPTRLKLLTKKATHMPLTPYQLHNVIVTPIFIQMERLGANTICPNEFTIENKNDFAIHIRIRALFPSITILSEQFLLGANTKKVIKFTYLAEGNGIQHLPLFVVVNYYYVIDLTVLVKIVSNTVKCLTKELLIAPSERRAFLELRNPINSDVKFKVDTAFYHLESFPNQGVIPAKKNMICTIIFNPAVGFLPMKDIAVISESGARELVEIHFDSRKASISLSSDVIDFGNVPLNIEVFEDLIIKNNSDQLVPINIEFKIDEPCPEININPSKTLIWQKEEIAIRFTLKFDQLVRFCLPVNVITQYQYSQIITLKGTIVFPQVHFWPAMIKVPKVPSGSVVRTPFKIGNLSLVMNTISFPILDFPEFKVKTLQEENAGLVTLAPKEKQELILEFSPREPVAYCIYLPYILNGLVGPPELNRQESLKCSRYLDEECGSYKKPIEIHSKLNVLKILCASGKKWLQFNKLELTFRHVVKNKEQFVVTNISGAVQMVTFDLTYAEHFSFLPDNVKGPLDDENMIIILKPEESFQMTIEFKPDSIGVFKEEVPIFVREFSNRTAFNNILLIGNNMSPEILPSITTCYLPPAAIDRRLEKKLTIELKEHTCGHNLHVKSENEFVKLLILEKEIVSPVRAVVHALIIFEPKEECIVETKLNISCSCKSSAEIHLFASGDPTMIINFMSDEEIVQYSTYPFFPTAEDETPYSALMHSNELVIEKWLYTQGYMYQNYYKIPDDITRYNIDKSKKKPLGDQVRIPLVQLLINLMDKFILKYVDNKVNPGENMKDRTTYDYVTYRNTISFLKSQGVSVPGLRPEHLLPYDKYVYFRDYMTDAKLPQIKEEFTADEFYRFSKQKWMDLFFYIYKILVLKRIMEPTPPNSKKTEPTLEPDFIMKDKELFDTYYKDNLKRFARRSRYDAKLMLWLEYHYNRQRKVLWPEENFNNYQYIDSFSNISDSLALAAVTSVYCPYLIDELKDMYVTSKEMGHKFHNACKLIQAWQTLQLSFDINPQTIVEGNKMNIVFIVTYLYEVLPHYYPTKEVRIEALLSEYAKYDLAVTNHGDVAVKYVAMFFGDGSEMFTLDQTQITIPPKVTKTLLLTYGAKKVVEVSCIVVLSGETSSLKYAKSMAISVRGIPNISECKEIRMEVETYQQIRKRIPMTTPYIPSYKAKLYICFDEPKSYKDLNSIGSIKGRNIPREINFVQNECSFDASVAVITMDMCFLSHGLRSFYLYFCNKSEGDFCVNVKIMSTTKETSAQEILVQLPDNFFKPCFCKRGIISLHCPKTITVNLPCRNVPLWNSIGVVIDKCFTSNSATRMFKKYYGTPLIFRVLRYYLERIPDGFLLPSEIFDDQAEFTMVNNKKFSTICGPLRIRDVTTAETFPLVIHWNDKDVEDDILELRNVNDREIRFYKLLFVLPHKLSNSSHGSTFRVLSN